MRGFDFKRLIAVSNLGYHFLLHFLKKPFVYHRSGLKLFMENYKGDGLVPLEKSDEAAIRRHSQCIDCGLCSMVCPALLHLPREKFPGPHFVVTTYSRSFSDLKAAHLDLSLCASCAECEKICPNAVPIKEAILFIQTKIAEQIKLGVL